MLKCKVIKTKSQYNQYCKELERLLETGGSKAVQDEVDLLTLLIEKWDGKHNSFEALDPIRLLHSLMVEHNIKAKNLVHLLDVSKGYVSEILHYKKGLSKEVVRKLSAHFTVSQEAFNRAYKLKVVENTRLKNTSVIKTGKS